MRCTTRTLVSTEEILYKAVHPTRQTGQPRTSSQATTSPSARAGHETVHFVPGSPPPAALPSYYYHYHCYYNATSFLTRAVLDSHQVRSGYVPTHARHTVTVLRALALSPRRGSRVAAGWRGRPYALWPQGISLCGTFFDETLFRDSVRVEIRGFRGTLYSRYIDTCTRLTGTATSRPRDGSTSCLAAPCAASYFRFRPSFLASDLAARFSSWLIRGGGRGGGMRRGLGLSWS